MSIAVYMDVHISRMVIQGLRLRGINVLTAQEDGNRLLPDPLSLDRAGALDRVLVTQRDGPYSPIL